jgi:hypothetical protein
MGYSGAGGKLIHEKNQKQKISGHCPFKTAGGLMGPPKKEDIRREKTILMTSLQTHRASAVSSPELHYTYQ